MEHSRRREEEALSSDNPDRSYLDIFARERGVEKKLIRLSLVGEQIELQGDEVMARQLRQGVRDPVSGTRVTPEDGYYFLATVERVFSKGALYTSGIIEVLTESPPVRKRR